MSPSESRLPAFHLGLIRRSIEQSLMHLREGSTDLDDAEDVVGFLLLAQIVREMQEGEGGPTGVSADASNVSSEAIPAALAAAAPALERERLSSGAIDLLVIGTRAASEIVSAPSRSDLLATMAKLEKSERAAVLRRLKRDREHERGSTP